MDKEKDALTKKLTVLQQHQQLLQSQEQEKQRMEEQPKVEKALALVKQPVDLTRYRNERNLMFFPFCSTSRRKRTKTIKYATEDGKRWLEVSANAEYGMAKIWDFDVLRFALSKAGEVARMHGCIFPPHVDFTAYECLKTLGKKINQQNYKWVEEALTRLLSTVYRGNIFREDDEYIEGFTLIKYRYKKDGDNKIKGIRLFFDERLVESARYNKGLLEIDPKVLKEDSGLKKRLLELVRTSMGSNAEWIVGLERLQQLCAHDGKLKHFKGELKKFDDLPWKVNFSDRVMGGENVVFTKKNNDFNTDVEPTQY